MDYKKLNNIVGWGVFTIATLVYILTLEPTASLWDCGEYITTAHGLQVGHPPGAPLFMMIGRLFASLAPAESAAYMVNMMSGLCSSFSILFLFWSITMIAKKIATKGGIEFSDDKKIAVLGSGIVGALAYTFVDSFWFSAVEGEVYAMSAFFSAIVFWAILKWEENDDTDPRSDRWIILIAFLLSLISIGVHLLNLLAIPAIAFVYYFKRYKVVNAKGLLITGVVSIAILGVIQSIIIPGVINLGLVFEVSAVNSFGLPFYSGMIFLGLFIIAVIVFGVRYSIKKQLVWLNTVVMSLAVFMIGYTCFAMIVIRSNANPPLDENNPEDAVSALAYLNREQYGDWPISSGPFWNSQENTKDKYKDGTPVHIRAFVVKNGRKDLKGFKKEEQAKQYVQKQQKKAPGKYSIEEKYYLVADRKNEKPTYKDGTFLPRMYSKNARHVEGYKRWSRYKGNLNRPSARYRQYDMQLNELKSYGSNPQVDQYKKSINSAIAELDRKEGLYLPTMGENLTYMMRYQFGWMYWRYFMWNFSGRQNDEQGHGNPLDGNWISGLNFIDKEHIGDQSNISEDRDQNIAHNKFYMLPLILGLIGFVFQLFKDRKRWFIVFLLFIFTGLAIVFYLNQKPYEPRERDYAFAGSFYAFTIWIGIGVYALFDAVKNFKLNEYGKVFGAIAGLGLVALIGGSSSGNGQTIGYSIFYILLIAAVAHLVMYGLGTVNKNGKIHAVAAVLIGLVAPLIMGFEGWNDHDRSNRYYARDNAKAYLDSCEPNAILFTHGDNDTFPVWYVQEVEAHGRDKRVVNLSLLGTSWYAEQMKMRAYESAPVPFSFTEEQIRQHGGRDVLYMPKVIERGHQSDRENGKGSNADVQRAYRVVQAAKKKKYWNIKEVIEFVKKDENTIEKWYVDGAVAYFPSANFYLDITEADKDKIIDNGIVPASRRSEIVDRMEWSVTGDFMYKNTLMILDLVANNNWNRPIYFGASAQLSAYAGLHPYFSNEGLVYQLLPIKAKSNYQSEINTEVMYDNLMNKFKWGNIDNPSVNIDYYIRRPSQNVRSQFAQLSQALIIEATELKNKERTMNARISFLKDSLNNPEDDPLITMLKNDIKASGELRKEKVKRAKDVVDRGFDILPEENFPYNRATAYLIGTYYQACKEFYGQADSTGYPEADVQARMMLKASAEEMEYILSLEHRFFVNSFNALSSAWDGLNILRRGVMMITPDSDISKEIALKMEDIAGQIKARSIEMESIEQKQMLDRIKSGGSAQSELTSSQRLKYMFKDDIFREELGAPR